MKLTAQILILSLAGAALTPALAGPEDNPDLHAWGKFSPVRKSDFFELKYKVREEGKRPKNAQAFVRLDEDAKFFLDRQVPLNALEKGAKVWIFGHPVERESQTAEGRTQVDRQILNTIAIVTGAGLRVATETTGPADQKWCEAEITRAGQGLHVEYEGQDYKVVCLKSFGVLSRQLMTKRPKLTKKLLVELQGMTSDVLPPKAKEDAQAFTISSLVVLDKRLQRNVYPLLLK